MAYYRFTNPDDPAAEPYGSVEVFYADADDCVTLSILENVSGCCEIDELREFDQGWYWWPCFPGCLPDGEPVGPFATETEAMADAGVCDG